jgi:hypothetical protein
MVQFEHEAATRPVLAGAIATIQCTGEKKVAATRPEKIFQNKRPLAKTWYFALINAPYAPHNAQDNNQA